MEYYIVIITDSKQGMRSSNITLNLQLGIPDSFMIESNKYQCRKLNSFVFIRLVEINFKSDQRCLTISFAAK